jgi:hypothetical protein
LQRRYRSPGFWISDLITDGYKELFPGDAATFQFGLRPVNACVSTCPGQVRFNWRRNQALSVQTFVIPVGSLVSITSPPLSATIILSDPETLTVGKPCSLFVEISSKRDVSTKVSLSAEAPKSTYYMVGPIKVCFDDCRMLFVFLFAMIDRVQYWFQQEVNQGFNGLYIHCKQDFCHCQLLRCCQTSLTRRYLIAMPSQTCLFIHLDVGI